MNEEKQRVQPVLCSFAADVMCPKCANLWKAYIQEGCDDINSLRYECPQCGDQQGFSVRWWPSEIPKEFLEEER